MPFRLSHSVILWFCQRPKTPSQCGLGLGKLSLFFNLPVGHAGTFTLYEEGVFAILVLLRLDCRTTVFSLNLTLLRAVFAADIHIGSLVRWIRGAELRANDS